MPDELPTQNSTRSRLTFGRGFVLGLAVFFCGLSAFLCHRALRVMERAVDVMERVDAKMDRAIAAAPRVVAKGKEVVQSIDTDELKESARQEVNSLKEKGRSWLSQRMQKSPATAPAE